MGTADLCKTSPIGVNMAIHGCHIAIVLDQLTNKDLIIYNGGQYHIHRPKCFLGQCSNFCLFNLLRLVKIWLLYPFIMNQRENMPLTGNYKEQKENTKSVLISAAALASLKP